MMFGINLFDDNDTVKELVQTVLTFIAIFAYYLLVELVLIPGFPSIVQLYKALLVSALPTVSFWLVNKGIKVKKVED